MNSRRIGAALRLACLLALGPYAVADNPNPGNLVSVEGSNQNSEKYSGQSYSIDWDRKSESGDHILLGTRLFTRRFNDGTRITDAGVAAGYVAMLASNMYWENGALVNPGATFNPLWAANTTPHYVLGANDFSLGLSFNQYKVMSAGTVSPKVLREFRYFTLGAGFYATRTYDDVIAYYGVATVPTFAGQFLRIDYSLGRTIEDQGIETEYHALTIGYTFKIAGRWKVGPWASYFRGTIRAEDSYGIKLDLGL